MLFGIFLGFDLVANLVEGRSGSVTLLYDGFKFYKHSLSKDIMLWCCSKKKSGCTAKARTQHIDNIEMMQMTQPYHNHDQNAF